MKKPFFTVIIPTYNRSALLVRAIESVLCQKYSDFELIIVNDGSSDDTEKVLNSRYASLIRSGKMILLHQENRGVSSARNKGVQSARGSYFAFLDSDDEWYDNKLSMQFEYIQKHEKVYLLHCNEIWIRNAKRVNPMLKHEKEGGDIFDRSLELCLISPSAVVIRSDVYHEFSGFDEDFIVCEDYDLWLKICNKYLIDYIPEPLVRKYGGHEDQLSRKFFAMDYWRVKSMMNLFDSGNIEKSRKERIAEVVVRKSSILLKGYIKHANMQNYDVIYSLNAKAREYLNND